MSFRALGATRPGWCPQSSLKPGERDPCEVQYGFDLPIVGKTSFGLPIPAITNDALNTVEQRLPSLLDATLPVIEQKVQPWINSVIADVQYEAPALVDKIIKQQVLPELQTQKEELLAQADVIMQKALLGTAVITLLAIGGFWWVKKRA